MLSRIAGDVQRAKKGRHWKIQCRPVCVLSNRFTVLELVLLLVPALLLALLLPFSLFWPSLRLSWPFYAISSWPLGPGPRLASPPERQASPTDLARRLSCSTRARAGRRVSRCSSLCTSSWYLVSIFGTGALIYEERSPESRGPKEAKNFLQWTWEQLEGRLGRKAGEELPDSIGQSAGRKAGSCGLKPAATESTTENIPPVAARQPVRVKRRGKSSPLAPQGAGPGKPHLEQGSRTTARPARGSGSRDRNTSSGSRTQSDFNRFARSERRTSRRSREMILTRSNPGTESGV